VGATPGPPSPGPGGGAEWDTGRPREGVGSGKKEQGWGRRDRHKTHGGAAATNRLPGPSAAVRASSTNTDTEGASWSPTPVLPRARAPARAGTCHKTLGRPRAFHSHGPAHNREPSHLNRHATAAARVDPWACTNGGGRPSHPSPPPRQSPPSGVRTATGSRTRKNYDTHAALRGGRRRRCHAARLEVVAFVRVPSTPPPREAAGGRAPVAVACSGSAAGADSGGVTQFKVGECIMRSGRRGDPHAAGRGGVTATRWRGKTPPEEAFLSRCLCRMGVESR